MTSAELLAPVTNAGTRTPVVLLLVMVLEAVRGSSGNNFTEGRGNPYVEPEDYYDEDDYHCRMGGGSMRDCEAFVALIDQQLGSRNLTRDDERACRVIARSMVCYENEHCRRYGKCCLDRVPVGPPHQDMVCRYESGMEVYMLERCPERWEDSEVRRMCERQDAAAAAEPFTALPVTSRATNRTYSNYYCAVCHDDNQYTALWTPSVRCLLRGEVDFAQSRNITERVSSINATYIWNNIVYRNDGRWGVHTDDEKARFHDCELTFKPNGMSIDSCRNVHNCDNIMSGIEETLCTSFDKINTKSSDQRTKETCELCATSTCSSKDEIAQDDEGSGDDFPVIYTSLYILDIRDGSGSGDVGAISLCSQWQVWSPFRGGQCLDVRCDVPGSRLEGSRCVPPPVMPGEDTPSPPRVGISTGAESGNQSHADFIACPKHYLNVSDYELANNGSVFVQLFGRSFERDQYEIRSGGQLVVCVPEASDQPDSKFGVAIAHISSVCAAFSVLCLLLHIGAFLAGALNGNLPGMCVTSLAVCLLIVYFCFLVSATQEPGTSGCRHLAIVTLAALEASVSWTNIMGFDVFLTLRRASSNLQVTRGRRLRRFILYILYVWMLTAVVVAAAVMADQIPAVPEPYRPGFGERLCWFSRRRPLVIFFAAPLAVTMTANVVLFAAITRIIRQMGSASAKAAKQPRKHLRLFSRLAVMMGLSWIVGLLAGLLDFPPLYYVFVLLHTLQGVLIFAGFTVTRAARTWLRRQAAVCGGTLNGALNRCRRPQPDASNSDGTSQSPDTGRQKSYTRPSEITKL